MEGSAEGVSTRPVDAAPNDNLDGARCFDEVSSRSFRCLLLAGAAVHAVLASTALTAAFADTCAEVTAVKVEGGAWPGKEKFMEFLTRVKGGEFDFVALAPPCEGFSRALFSNKLGPPPLRNAIFPWGYPWLEGKNLMKAEK